MVIKTIYKVLRSIVFSVTLVIVGLYVITYSLLSIPAFTNWIKDLATQQLSEFLGGEVLISDFDIYPFSEVKISGLEVIDPEGEKCLEINTLGAGISLWKLFSEQRIELTFGEIIGLKGYVSQRTPESPLNIDFIIKAFSPKDQNKEKKSFELTLRNVVLRKSSLTFRRDWLRDKNIGPINLGDLRVEDLAADISFPKISDKGIEVDLRRLSMKIPGVTTIETLALEGDFSEKGFFVKDFTLELPATRLYLAQIGLPIEEGESVKDAITGKTHEINISQSYITPSDFRFLWTPLEEFTEPLSLTANLIGTPEEITVEMFELKNSEILSLNFSGAIEGLGDIKQAEGELSGLQLNVTSVVFIRLKNALKGLPAELEHILGELGDVQVKGNFAASANTPTFQGNVDVTSDVFVISFEGGASRGPHGSYHAEGELNVEDLKLQTILPKLPMGNITANMVAEVTGEAGVIPDGMISLVVEGFEYKGKEHEGFSLNLSKEREVFDGDILMHNDIGDIEGKFGGDLTGEEVNGRLDMDISDLNLSELIDMKQYSGYLISGNLNLDGYGNKDRNVTGSMQLNKFSFANPEENKSLRLNRLELTAEVADSVQSINMKSDWVDARVEGCFKPKELPTQFRALAMSFFPALIEADDMETPVFATDVEFDILIKKNNSVPVFFNLPVRLLVPVTISGTIQGEDNSATLSIDIPYLQQGKDKLIYDTKFTAEASGQTGEMNAVIQTTVPVKKGDLALNVNIYGHDNHVSTDVRWVNTENTEFKGHLLLDTEFSRNRFSLLPQINLRLLPSILQMGPADWHITQSEIVYYDKTVSIEGLKLWHDRQFVEISGVASEYYDDAVTITLNDIDVDYVFDMLQINYVTFGGVATGEITGHALLSGDPVAETENLEIKEFTYNGTALGTCLASSRWNNTEKEIEISADIRDRGHQNVYGYGGIWLGKDSLCFNISANKVPVDFVQPFMAVFSSHVGGFATGDVKLFGTFHDIDMTGKIFADSVAVKLDYTNTIYHGSDSVYLYPGQIEIPHFRLYDKNGNSALLTGELTHRYFHDPSFTFRLSDANNFLCYDTNSELNPDWYGTLYGTGSALLRGVPGDVEISADMTVSGASNFTFVLNDTEYATDYQFLTFSDRRKEMEKENTELTADDFKAMLKKSMQEEGGVSKFGIDIRATVTPDVLFTLVMDPGAGDKITARGEGAMQVKYESDNDEMMMYGKYQILEGNYNFSLQDIILRDFKIKEGSYISFNGNPLGADLDISATYRVNTNLTDLDKSFSTDRDLNRTNVPVDAVLSVTGNMVQPDITFDIELPTLTQEVERKVKSIISTDDMMNRQIIYLLALNRFYTPEYMGGTTNGGELTAVASSTISSQLSNMLGQLTDKFSVSPSFRSDKGDFSDIEVDVALSSRLLNNRLLINGNFGYRDRSTSNTTFVGDFDVEYLLSKNGNLRLKAYNHFNDQNYYLREALTTQGLGVVYRRDFDDWFTFLKRKKKKTEEDGAED